MAVNDPIQPPRPPKSGVSRRGLLNYGVIGIAGVGFNLRRAAGSGLQPKGVHPVTQTTPASQGAVSAERGAQRLSLERLRTWEALGYGMFIHFGISTFTGQEWSDGRASPSVYNPDRLDVDQWIQIARDAGMKYAVLTTKHVAGHCLWPSRFTDYSVARSGNTTDVVADFVKACERRGVRPGFYYCSFDNHHRFGSVTPDQGGIPGDTTVDEIHAIERTGKAYTTSAYQDFETSQIEELLTQYGKITEVWIDEPGVLGHGYRTFLYRRITELQPDCVVVMNGSWGDVGKWDPRLTWPQDVVGYEQVSPPPAGHVAWRSIEGEKYYLPAEVYDCIDESGSWFYHEGGRPKTEDKLLELYRGARQRGANLLLDVPPDRHGLIPEAYRNGLMRLKQSAGL